MNRLFHRAAVLVRSRPPGGVTLGLRRLAGVLGILLLSLTARANPGDLAALPLEQLLQFEIQAGSHLGQSMAVAPAVVSVVTAAQIRDYGHRTLAEVLRSLPGLQLSYDRNYSYLGVRGFSRAGDYNSRVLLLVDGYRFNDNVYDQASIGTDFPIDLALVERVEFIPGPGSAAYGSNAVFGVINVVTRTAAHASGGQGGLAYGSGRTGELRVSLGQQLARGELLLGLALRDSRGADWQYPELVSRGVEDGWVRGKDGDRSQKFLLRYADPSWKLLLIHGERSKGIPTGAYGTAAQAEGNETVDATTSADLNYRAALPGAWALDARAFVGRYTYRGRYVYDLPPLLDNVDRALGQWWGIETRLTAPPYRGNRLVLGVEYQVDRHQDQQNFDAPPNEYSYLDDYRRGQRTGLYLEDELRWGASRANLGLRYDRVPRQGGLLSPKLALVHELEAQRLVKLLLGSAYRMPNAYELFYQSPGDAGQKPNPELRRERVRTLELAYEQHQNERLRWQVSAYHYVVHDLIAAVTDPEDGMEVFRNVGDAHALGALLALERRWTDEQALKLSLSLQRAYDQHHQRLHNSPRVLAKLAYARELPNSLGRLGLEVQYTGPRLTRQGTLGGHVLANLNLRTSLAPRTTLSLGIYNLLDRRYGDPGGVEHVQAAIAQDRRNFRLGLEYTWP